MCPLSTRLRPPPLPGSVAMSCGRPAKSSPGGTSGLPASSLAEGSKRSIVAPRSLESTREVLLKSTLFARGVTRVSCGRVEADQVTGELDELVAPLGDGVDDLPLRNGELAHRKRSRSRGMTSSPPLPSPAASTPTHDRRRYLSGLPHHELGRTCELVRDCDLRGDQLAAGRIDRTPKIAEWRQPRHAKRDVRRPLAPGPAERVADDDTHRRARELAQAVTDAPGRPVGIEREQHERPGTARVRRVDSGRGAHEPVMRLGDHERRTGANDLPGLAQDPLDVPWVTVRAGQLDRPGRRLDLVEGDHAPLHLRDRLLGDHHHVRVDEPSGPLGRLGEQRSEVVTVTELRDPLERDHSHLR